MNNNLHDDAFVRLQTIGAEELLLEGIQSMITGAVEGLMVNLGHSVMCDPALSQGYGEAAVRVAVKALTTRKTE